MTSPLRLYLMRHGETRWSLTGQHTGRTDLELTPNGELQARRLAAALAGVDFVQVLTSPLQRARRTCELSGLMAGARVEPDLTEWDYGDYEGRRTDDIRQERPGWTVWDDGCPNGERIDAVSERADRVIGALRDGSGNVALFTHAQFAAVLAARWLGLPLRDGRHFPLATASVSILGLAAAPSPLATIQLWNSVPAAPEVYGRAQGRV